MRSKALYDVLVLCSACACMFGPLAASARAQDAPGDIGIVVSDGDTEKAKDCCTYLGIYMDELTASMKEKAGYPRETGVVISSVEPGGPAEQAGIEGGDICYLFNGVKVKDASQLGNLVRGRKAGEKVAIVIYRDGEEKKLFVKLDRRAPLQSPKDKYIPYSVEDLRKIMGGDRKSINKFYLQSVTRGHLGMALVDLNEDLAPYFSVKEGEGVLIFSVGAESPAAKAGIKGGDVIVSVNGVAVRSSGDVSAELAELEKGDMVSLDVLRRGIKKSYKLEADESFGEGQIFVAPFEHSEMKVKKAPLFPGLKDSEMSKEETLKMREEMKLLQERIKELEDRLGDVEKKE